MPDGDPRRALMALEVAVLSSQSEIRNPQSAIHISLDIAEQSIQRKAIVYDGTGDEHYDAASALIKSMRGSDPDAAVYWVARMLEAGGKTRLLARRLAPPASGDICYTHPPALLFAPAAVCLVAK